MITTLYHGSKVNHRFKDELANTFLATKLEFTNNAEYGGPNGVKYQVQVDLGKCFDSTNCNDIKLLYANKMRLTDPWLHAETPLDFGDDDDDVGFPDNDLWEGFNPSRDYYKTAQAFCQSKTIKTSTWEAIEESVGVVDWIKQHYNSCLILERGFTNFIVFNKKSIKNVKLLTPKK